MRIFAYIQVIDSQSYDVQYLFELKQYSGNFYWSRISNSTRMIQQALKTSLVYSFEKKISDIFYIDNFEACEVNDSDFDTIIKI